jgi:uncharacterized repeat protein (TIGR03803 family)
MARRIEMQQVGYTYSQQTYSLLCRFGITLIAVAWATVSMAQSTGTAMRMCVSKSARARFEVLYAFPGGKAGIGPGNVIRDAAGNLYGMTGAGGDLKCDLTGSLGCGVVFKLNSAPKETVLHRFHGNPTDQGTPFGGVVRDSAGHLYGTTSGIPLYNGTVFKVDRNGKETVLYKFNGGSDGLEPLAGLVRDGAGNLYGTTNAGGIGGPSGQGVVFKVDASGKETVLYSFSGGTDGAGPMAGLILDSAGNLYGTTASSGALGLGVAFKLDTSGTEHVLHSFTGGADGAAPLAGVVRDSAGNIYGTTANRGNLQCNLNGSGGCGVVFKLNAAGKLTALHTFAGTTDGGVPSADLLLDATGNLYGATGFGGDLGCTPFGNGCGVVFKLDKTGKETVLHTFTGGSDRGAPSTLVQDGAGNLYGAAAIGRVSNSGVVFRIAP